MGWVFPLRCGLCDRVGRAGVCEECRAGFLRAGEVRLRAESEALAEVLLVYAFEGRAAQAVRRLKYERATVLGKPMAEILAREVGAKGWGAFDAAVPVPISAKRRRERGFNQSELLCEGFEAGWVRADWLKRVRHTVPQASLKSEARLKNLEGAFWASPEVRGKSVVLVDDVSTTGGTAVACAETLAAAGAAKVVMAAFCGESLS